MQIILVCLLSSSHEIWKATALSTSATPKPNNTASSRLKPLNRFWSKFSEILTLLREEDEYKPTAEELEWQR